MLKMLGANKKVGGKSAGGKTAAAFHEAKLIKILSILMSSCAVYAYLRMKV